MVVKDDLDRGVRWVGGIEEFEELDKFAAAMAVLDQGVNVTGEQIDASHQCQSAVPLILVIAHDGRASTRKGRAIRRGGGKCLDPWFLVVRDDGEAPATIVLALAACRLLTQHRYLPVDTEDFGHLELEVGIALLQVITYFVRLDVLPGQDFADRSLGQVPEAGMPRRRCGSTGMRGEQPSGP